MATEILESSAEGPVTHASHHDLESFVWVLGYCVLRKMNRLADLVESKSIYATAQTLLERSFGKVNVIDILDQRIGVLGLDWIHFKAPGWVDFVENNSSIPLRDVMIRFSNQLHQRNVRPTSEDEVVQHNHLTHEAARQILANAIVRLRSK